MRLLAFNDVHCDTGAAWRVVSQVEKADVAIGAGDFCSKHQGLDETIEILKRIPIPTILVPGNNETADELRAACGAWDTAAVLHGETRSWDGQLFFGLGGGLTTGWDWSFDLTEDEFGEYARRYPAEGAIVVLHQPPFGALDSANGKSSGSRSLRRLIDEKQPALVFCGHVHECWGLEKPLGTTRVINAGPGGTIIDF